MLSGVGHVLTYSDSVRALVGASGAISGLVGAYLYLYPRGRVSTLMLPLPIRVKLPAWVYIALWFVVQCALVMVTVGRGGLGRIMGSIIGFGVGLIWTD